ncbi:MAG: TRAP transporter fused permease subunit, partial [Synergistaceae bacterium]|nr:TRAP transporter fused permease subunit [Synergistaceae bacterium]
MRKYDTEARFRTPSGWQLKLIVFLAVAMSAFHFYTAGFGLLAAQKQGAVHLILALALVFLLYPIKSTMPKNAGIPIYDFVFAILASVPLIYLVTQLNTIAMTRSGLPTKPDIVMGFMLIAFLLEATRRISNPILPILAIAALLYCYFGASIPGSLFHHRGFSVRRIVNHMYLGTEGIFGTPLEVSSTFVFMFILFGSVLEKTGMGRFIIDLSLALAGWSTGGPAKVAVVASGLMGTISGSSVANVCTTGMFTIPLMKSVGYKPYFAGAVEAVASTGGQIMPPVMGAGAFIMAQMLGVGYLEVALAAVVPALLYYFAVIVQVHFEANRLGLKGLSREQLPSIIALLKEKGFLLIPLIAIIYLLVAGYTPLMSAFGGILASLALSWANFILRWTMTRMAFLDKTLVESLRSLTTAQGREDSDNSVLKAIDKFDANSLKPLMRYIHMENIAREALLTPRRIIE